MAGIQQIAVLDVEQALHNDSRNRREIRVDSPRRKRLEKWLAAGIRNQQAGLGLLPVGDEQAQVDQLLKKRMPSVTGARIARIRKRAAPLGEGWDEGGAARNPTNASLEL